MRLALFIFVYLVTVYVHACNEFNAVCRAICVQDGDQLGIVIKEKCYCANFRNIDDVFVKVPLRGGMVKAEPKKYVWE